MSRIRVVERIDPKQVVRRVAALGLDLRAVASCLAVHPKTIERWLDGRAEPGDAAVRSLEKLDGICQHAKKLLKPSACRKWFSAPAPTLGGEAPIALIRRGDLDQVRNVLGMLEWGIYS